MRVRDGVEDVEEEAEARLDVEAARVAVRGRSARPRRARARGTAGRVGDTPASMQARDVRVREPREDRPLAPEALLAGAPERARALQELDRRRRLRSGRRSAARARPSPCRPGRSARRACRRRSCWPASVAAGGSRRERRRRGSARLAEAPRSRRAPPRARRRARHRRVRRRVELALALLVVELEQRGRGAGSARASARRSRRDPRRRSARRRKRRALSHWRCTVRSVTPRRARDLGEREAAEVLEVDELGRASGSTAASSSSASLRPRDLVPLTARRRYVGSSSAVISNRPAPLLRAWPERRRSMIRPRITRAA